MDDKLKNQYLRSQSLSQLSDDQRFHSYLLPLKPHGPSRIVSHDVQDIHASETDQNVRMCLKNTNKKNPECVYGSLDHRVAEFEVLIGKKFSRTAALTQHPGCKVNHRFK